MYNVKNLLLIFILIFAFLISLSDKVLAANVSEKDRYLAEERGHIEKTTGYGYDNCFFFTNEEGRYYNKNINKEADNYFYKYNTVTEENTKILEKHVVCYYPYEEYLYCALEDNSIIRISHKGEDKTLIFKGDGNITHLYVDGYEDIKVLYFVMNDICYRYFVNEKILDKLFYHKNIYSMNPVSNYKIEWRFTDPLWIKYVEEMGELEDYGDRRVTFIVNYDVLNNKHILLEEQQNPYPPDNIYYLLGLNNSENIVSEEEIAKFVETSIIEEIVANRLISLIYFTELYYGHNEIFNERYIDKNTNEYIYKNNKRYSKVDERFQDAFCEKYIKNFIYANFSKEIAKFYDESDMVIIVDGVSYIYNSNTEIDELYDDYSYKILSVKKNKIIVELCIPYKDGMGISNKYTITEISKVDGKWLITYQDFNKYSNAPINLEDISKYNPNTSDSVIFFQTIPALILVCLILLIKKWRDMITQKKNL